ncbi:MAG: hypothetical protein QOE87_1861 [Gaiellales bacterium]|jgi:hypothetical protein|nr:hypothetical protein [Gaiellales bacterium]
MSVIHLVEHDWRAPHALFMRINELVDGRAGRLIVELVSERVDTPLLQLLVVTDRMLAAHGGCMIVLCAEEPARAALRATGLDFHLTVVGSLWHAVDLLDPPTGSRHLRPSRPDCSA